MGRGAVHWSAASESLMCLSPNVPLIRAGNNLWRSTYAHTQANTLTPDEEWICFSFDWLRRVHVDISGDSDGDRAPPLTTTTAPPLKTPEQ